MGKTRDLFKKIADTKGTFHAKMSTKKDRKSKDITETEEIKKKIRRGERAQRRGCRKTSGFLLRETGISGNFVGRIKGAKCPFDLQFLTWDFS